MKHNVKNRKDGFATRAIHSGYNPSSHQNALSPPIYLTSTYAFDTVDEYEAAAVPGGMNYGRETNPTTSLLEDRIADLEGAEAAIMLASGEAAISTLLLTFLSQGDEVVVHQTMFGSTMANLKSGLTRFGVKIVTVDLNDPSNLDAALTERTKIVLFETLVNPTLDVLDLAAIAARIKGRGPLLVVDSTFCSPYIQRPLEFGADFVVHSATKYLNGHGDVLAGVVVGKKEHILKIRDTGLRYLTGATLSPLAASLVLRGLKTLQLRMDRHSSTALALAQAMEGHPSLAYLRYPFLPSDRHYHIAKKQMCQGSGLVTFGLQSGYEGARRMMDKLHLVKRAVSLGDTHSLILHEAGLAIGSAKIRGLPKPVLSVGVTEELLRISVGLEDPEDIIDDVLQALS